MDAARKSIVVLSFEVLKRALLQPETSSLLMFFVLFGITAILQKNFFEAKSIVRTINSFAPLILLAMGQAIVVVSGGIDLSSGAALSLLTCVLTTVMRRDDPVTGVYALIIAFLVALGTGVVNGLGIGYLRIPPVIVTFATSYAWLGIALFLRPTPGGESVPWFRVFYNMRVVEGVPEVLKSLGNYVPPALLLIVGACVLWYVVSRTRTGRYIYAVGSNIESAYVSGINTGKTQMLCLYAQRHFDFPGSSLLCWPEPDWRCPHGGTLDASVHRCGGCGRNCSFWWSGERVPCHCGCAHSWICGKDYLFCQCSQCVPDPGFGHHCHCCHCRSGVCHPASRTPLR